MGVSKRLRPARMRLFALLESPLPRIHDSTQRRARSSVDTPFLTGMLCPPPARATILKSRMFTTPFLFTSALGSYVD